MVGSSRIFTGDVALKPREMGKFDGTQLPATRERPSELSLDQLSVGTQRALLLRLSLSADFTLGTKENTVHDFAFYEGSNVIPHEGSEFHPLPKREKTKRDENILREDA